MAAASLLTIGLAPSLIFSAAPARRPATARPLRVAHRQSGIARSLQNLHFSTKTPRKLAPMRILVTGAAGFIGSDFVRHRLAANPRDHVLAHDPAPYGCVRGQVPANRPFLAGRYRDGRTG